MTEPAAFFNPVRLWMGAGSLGGLPLRAGGKRAALLGTRGSLERGLEARVRGLLGTGLVAVHRGVISNPTVASIQEAALEILPSRPELLVAIGGGSTIDTAKGVAAALCASGQTGPKWVSDHLRQSIPYPVGFSPLPIIAVPTTAGTGAEVTPFATVWDERTGAKHSLTHDRLFPTDALIDPELTLTLPPDLTVLTGLDAFSHALESLWNRNRNPVSEALASRAARSLLVFLPRAMIHPQDLGARVGVQEAAVLAGLAISGTRTALAHSMSYPLTASLGLPHGLACGFTLAEVLAWNGANGSEAVAPVLAALGADGVESGVRRIYEFFAELNLKPLLRKHLHSPEPLRNVPGTLIHPGRAPNNLTPIAEEAARELLVRAWNRISDA
ncbi:MAG: phosphonoacetaldehyde reductase [Bdellovibrionales bacterium]|nr:phosphonoacetaldehyde reductase [Bdellovibrionales bacterium]